MRSKPALPRPAPLKKRLWVAICLWQILQEHLDDEPTWPRGHWIDIFVPEFLDSEIRSPIRFYGMVTLGLEGGGHGYQGRFQGRCDYDADRAELLSYSLSFLDHETAPEVLRGNGPPPQGEFLYAFSWEATT